MGMKARFKKKNVNKISVSAVEKHQLKLIRPEDDIQSYVNQIKISSSSENNSTLNKQVQCYHKINNLVQEDNLNLYELMKGILEIVCFGVNAKGGSLWMYEKDQKKIICKVAIGPESKSLEKVEVDEGKGIVGWVVSQKKHSIVYDTSKDKRFHGQTGDDTKSLMAAPLMYKDEVIGVIEVVNKENSSELYNDEDMAFLNDLSTVVSLHIKTSRSLRDQEIVLKRLETFGELHEKFSETLELDKLVSLVLQKAIGLLNAEVGSLWLVEESGEGIVCEYAYGPTKDKVQGVKLSKGTGIIGQVIDSKVSTIVEDCSKDERFSNALDQKTNFETNSLVTAPLTTQGEVIGAIQIINKKNGELFNADDLNLLGLFGASCAMYIKNARLFSAEKKAKDLSSLIEIGREITSTLNLDSVLLSVVNLTSQIIPYEEAGISTLKIGNSGHLKLRAVSGQMEVSSDDEKSKELEAIHNFIQASEHKEINIKSLEDVPEDQEKIKKYMEEHEIETFYLRVLSDDQGVLGVFSIESGGEESLN